MEKTAVKVTKTLVFTHSLRSRLIPRPLFEELGGEHGDRLASLLPHHLHRRDVGVAVAEVSATLFL